MQELGGLNPHHAVAGFGGGLASLFFLEPRNRVAALGSVFVGVVTAMYLTPVVLDVLIYHTAYRFSKNGELGLAFVLGLTAMVFIPAILGFAAWVRDTMATLVRVKIHRPPKPEDKE